jgi:hypothetical protein
MSLVCRSVVYAVVVGLVLVVACRIAAGPLLFGRLGDFAGLMAREQEKHEQLERIRSGWLYRLDKKIQALEGLLDGRLTLSQTIAVYRQVEADTPELSAVSTEEETARVIIEWVDVGREDDPRTVKALPRLRAEFEALFGHPYGPPVSAGPRVASSLQIV